MELVTMPDDTQVVVEENAEAEGEVVTTEAIDPSAIINAEINKKIDLAEGEVGKQYVQNTQVKFSFRPVENELGVKTKRASVELNLPYLTVDGILLALRDEKQRDLILWAVNDGLIKEIARTQVDDEKKPVNSQNELDVSKLTLEYIAGLPKAERGGGISKDTWAAFSKNYIEVMPAITGMAVDKVAKAATLFVAKFQPCKTDKPVLKLLADFLDKWFTGTTPEAQEEFASVYEFLSTKAKTLIESDSSLLDNLQ